MAAAAGPGGMPFNLAYESLGRRAEDPAQAGRPAFTFVEPERIRSWSYGEAWEQVTRIGRGLLARGLEPGDRVLVRLPHGPQYAFTFFGAVAAGLVPVPASPQLTAEEVAFLVADTGAKAVAATPDLAVPGYEGLVLGAAEVASLDGGGELPVTRAEQPAYLIYTSGTAARPKGVLHAHRSLLGRRLMIETWEELGAGDAMLHAGTLNWSYTLGVGLMDPWAAGAHATLYGGPQDPQQWPSLIERHGITVFAAVPTVYRQILKYGRPEAADLSALRHGLCAGEALPAALAAEWRARAGSELLEALGMTEISTYISSGLAAPVRPGSPGRPQPGRRVAILPVEPTPATPGDRPLPPGAAGLLAVHRSDPGLMLGYWNRPDEEAAVYRGEWFVGGDLASIDEQGYVWFEGRTDDVIKSFGYRLSPVEIESALATCPGVAEVAVIGLPVDEMKTLVTACVVPQDGADHPALRTALDTHATAHLAEYKRPHQYQLVGTLPRTRNGKVQRRALREQLLASR